MYDFNISIKASNYIHVIDPLSLSNRKEVARENSLNKKSGNWINEQPKNTPTRPPI